ncbi:hypothetical protein BHM03_00032693, partial [Ensete ventricosum]
MYCGGEGVGHHGLDKSDGICAKEIHPHLLTGTNTCAINESLSYACPKPTPSSALSGGDERWPILKVTEAQATRT